ncbi:MAG TPA: ATP-binding cassette domain-containing protein [Mycobacteriales bacterium]|nr:ATP-binding cassette domain-containing protein [Mycobacteriales bacterium]
MRDGATVIELRGITVDVLGPSGAKVRLLERADWRVGAGETWVVLGPNGAGKSTLLSVAGARRFPAEGTASVLGHRLGTTDLRELRRAVGHVDLRLADELGGHLPARAVVVTGRTASTVPLWSRYVESDWKRGDDLLRLVGAGKAAEQRFGTLSQGERARVLIARALMPGPELLILDEPAAGLDLVGREQLLHALDDLRTQQPDLAIVLVTHHVEEIPASASHAVVVSGGRIVAAGQVADVVTSEVLTGAYGTTVTVREEEGRFSARVRR